MGKESSGMKKAVLFLLSAAGLGLAAEAAGMAYFGKKNMDKAKERKEQNNNIICCGMGKSDNEIKPDTSATYIACMAGVANVTWEGIPEKDSLLDLSCVLGKITVTLPAGVKVEGEINGEPLDESLNAECEEDARVINIVGMSKLGDIKVVR